MENRDEQAKNLAYDILKECSSTLLIRLRYLSPAIAQLPTVANDKMSFGTDGSALYFEPYAVLLQYRMDPKDVTRNYLHCILHCIFMHPFVGEKIDQDAWSLACDIAVEFLINELNIPELQSRRSGTQMAFHKELEQNYGIVTAERLYHVIKERNYSPSYIHELRTMFYGDDHGLWFGSIDPENAEQMTADKQKIWKEVSRKVLTQAGTMDKDQNGSGIMVQALTQLHRTKVSYETFLRKFGRRGEALHTSTDEFDNAYYLYGIEHYGNMPLIEYLEYSEEKRIRDFVIAIDTSGSVRGDLVQSFVQKTFDILQQERNFFSRLNLYIIQCDFKIRESVHITSKQEFEDYLQNMQIQGLGSTDFRPVFRYVEDLQRAGQLKELQGLIYFTDGKGKFPKHRPDYPTAFILHEKNPENLSVPPWAAKLIVSEEDMTNGTF